MTVLGAELSNTRSVRRRFELLREIVVRDLKLRYRRSLLGIAWSQIGPLATMVVLSFVFSRVVPLHIAHYPEFVFVGLLPWVWFQSGITAATDSIVGGRDLIRHPGVQPVLLPIAAIAGNLANYLLALPVLLLFIGVGTKHLPWTITLLPVVIAVQFVVMAGPALILAAWNVTFRDIAQIVNVLLLPLFYATPIFYPRSSVPGRFGFLYTINPLTHLMTAYRAVLFYGSVPGLVPLVMLAAVGGAVFMAARVLFELRSRRFVEEL
jgi:lipopolysaccharide transport system permease protein